MNPKPQTKRPGGSMIAVVTPISESKCYSFHDWARGIFELDYPKDQLAIIFVVDTNGAKLVDKKIDEFIAYWPHPENCFVLSTFLKGNNAQVSDAVHWTKRAEFAAQLRNVAVKFVRSVQKPLNISHTFFVGSDIILAPDSLKTLTLFDLPLVSGLYVSRIQHKRLVLWYNEDDKSWGYKDFPDEMLSLRSVAADWTGMDVLLAKSEVIDTIDWDGYSLDKYGIGEDGYFFIEAKHAGFPLVITPLVTPLHAHQDGTVVSTRPTDPIGYNAHCPKCDRKSAMGKLYRDIEICCPECGTVYIADPFYSRRDINTAAKASGKPNRQI